MTDPHKDLYPWILWYIWKARNDKIFNGKEISSEDTLIHARVEAESWRIANRSEEDDVEFESCVPQSSPPRHPTEFWRSPLCRVDASWIDHGSVSGLGWCFLDGIGNETVEAQGCRRSLSALHAEMDCFLWAMSSLRERGNLSVHFQSDCLDLVSMVGLPAD
ncbi:uncharacterized protein LOC112088079 [Eutrema salsugineum]|uniref:uncharacterized protein LOC112088079 n=1 Tax=Eutrema salsugineum TaxID=72664 RepID=UPI000CED497F|nr:uncharacterized protein LOC112088079 [Eutrema salsugineum]